MCVGSMVENVRSMVDAGQRYGKSPKIEDAGQMLPVTVAILIDCHCPNVLLRRLCKSPTSRNLSLFYLRFDNLSRATSESHLSIFPILFQNVDDNNDDDVDGDCGSTR